MTVRFFILQAHYRSTLDFSNEALQAAEKGLAKLMQAARDVEALVAKGTGVNEELVALKEKVYEALCDDLNTPIALSHLFEAVRWVNLAKDGQVALSAEDLALLKELLVVVMTDVLGLVQEGASEGNEELLDGLIEMVLAERKEAKARKDFATSDAIRDRLKELGIQIKDTREGTEWTMIK